MQKQSFVNKSYVSAISKIVDAHEYTIKDATEKADIQAIVEISTIWFNKALIDESYHDELEIYFKDKIKDIIPQTVRYCDYDFIQQGNVVLTEYEEAAEFLTACKLFIKFSSDYELIVDNGTYTFYFNIDRVSEDVI